MWAFWLYEFLRQCSATETYTHRDIRRLHKILEHWNIRFPHFSILYGICCIFIDGAQVVHWCIYNMVSKERNKYIQVFEKYKIFSIYRVVVDLYTHTKKKSLKPKTFSFCSMLFMIYGMTLKAKNENDQNRYDQTPQSVHTKK